MGENYRKYQPSKVNNHMTRKPEPRIGTNGTPKRRGTKRTRKGQTIS